MSNTTVSSVSRTRRIALTVLGAATVAAGGLALAPHAGAAENPAKTPPAAVAPATHTDNGELNTQGIGDKTKGFIVQNTSGKHVHVASVKGDYIGASFENQDKFPIGTDLAPGQEQRWEMFWRWNFDGPWTATVTYATDDGSTAFAVAMTNDFWNSGQVNVGIPASHFVDFEIGTKDSAHLAKIKDFH